MLIDLLRRLDSGTDGMVYLAARVESDTHVVVKVPTAAGNDSIVHEATALRQCNHPNIIKMLGTVNFDGVKSLVLEYMPQGNLFKYLEDNSRFGGNNEDERRSIAEDIIRGLYYLHVTLLLIHRDIKPGNILLQAIQGKLQAKIADFGFARKLNPRTGMYKANFCKGTPRYMAPEIMSPDPSSGLFVYTRAVDIWGLGLIIGELCADVRWRPYIDMKSKEAMIARENGVPISLPPFRSAATTRRVHWCLKDNPHERPTALDLLEDYGLETPRP